ncbi:hypothetical protein SDC9_95647 [bioreactor metagenome]|uniref:SinR family protein n=1 Tax=bioreactor metagenome TaxID=1076179 RepID=A0A645A6X0_9ZZZZ
MTSYMITYDLNSQGQNYSKVIQAIKDSALSWCTFWKSSYLIKSSLTADQISDKITPHLDSNDRLIIIEVKNNYQGWLAEDDWKFIRENIF